MSKAPPQKVVNRVHQDHIWNQHVDHVRLVRISMWTMSNSPRPHHPTQELHAARNFNSHIGDMFRKSGMPFRDESYEARVAQLEKEISGMKAPALMAESAKYGVAKPLKKGSRREREYTRTQQSSNVGRLLMTNGKARPEKGGFARPTRGEQTGLQAQEHPEPLASPWD